MQQRNLGKSGLKVSVAGLGCNNFHEPTDQVLDLLDVHRLGSMQDSK
jgi:aryl-alcohol dehydrogenase-like predicted oxidoreductase